EHGGGMREESDQHRFASALPSLANHSREDLLMAAVNAVEISERGDRRSETPIARLEMPDDLHRGAGAPWRRYELSSASFCRPFSASGESPCSLTSFCRTRRASTLSPSSANAIACRSSAAGTLSPFGYRSRTSLNSRIARL